jgi:hypothetical protein
VRKRRAAGSPALCPNSRIACAAATNLFKLMLKYRPEDKKEKKARLRRWRTRVSPVRQLLTPRANLRHAGAPAEEGGG